jgi:hypothetical protein
LVAIARRIGILEEEFMEMTPRQLCAVLEDEARVRELMERAVNPCSTQSGRPKRAISGNEEPVKSSPETTAQKSARRKAFIEPTLAEKGFSTHGWANEAGVDHHTADNYLKGSTDLRVDTKNKLARALGLKPGQLPQ